MHSAGLHHTCVVHGAGQHTVTCASRQNDASAIGLQQAAIADHGVELVLFHLHRQQTAAFKLQTEVTARAHGDAALVRCDAALVADRVSQQRHIAAFSRVDLPEVHDRGFGISAHYLHLANG